MAEEKGEEKTPAEEKEKEEEEEEDPFAEIFSEDKDDKDEEDKGEEEEDIQEEEAKPPKKPIKKVLKPQVNVDEIVEERLSQVEKRIERRYEITDYLNSDEGKMFGKYTAQIRKAALDPRFINIPLTQLPAVILKPSAYTKVLQEAREEADREAADSVTGGNSTRTMTPEALKNIDPSKMSADEFRQLKERALRGEFKIK